MANESHFRYHPEFLSSYNEKKANERSSNHAQELKKQAQLSQGPPVFPGALLRQLLPGEFDDGDLLILLILLLTMKEEHRDPVSMIVAALVYFSSG